MLPHASRVYHSLVWYVVTRHCHEHDDRNNHITYQVTTFWLMRRTDHHDDTLTLLKASISCCKTSNTNGIEPLLGQHDVVACVMDGYGTSMAKESSICSLEKPHHPSATKRTSVVWPGRRNHAWVVGSTRTVASRETHNSWACTCWWTSVRVLASSNDTTIHGKTKAMSVLAMRVLFVLK